MPISFSSALLTLSKVIDWESLDAAVARQFSAAGAPALPSRLVLGLMYLQNLHKLSDEAELYRFWSHQITGTSAAVSSLSTMSRSTQGA